MRILHTADWHLGKRLHHFSRLEEQKQVLQEICRIADEKEVDAVVVAGDLFDAFNPPTEAVELLYKTLKDLSKEGRRAVVAIAGNHDSPDRIEAPDPLARECGILFAGYPHSVVPCFELESGLAVTKSEAGFFEVRLPGKEDKLRILSTPFANEYRLKTFLGLDNAEDELRELLNKKWQELAGKYCDDQGVNILLTHLYFMKKGAAPPEEPDDEKPILHVGGAQAIFSENIPRQIQYVALGHLHRRQTIDKEPCPVVYCGSPLAYSFSEANQDKFVVIVDAEPGKPVKYESIKLKEGKRLLRKRFEVISEAVEWLRENPSCLLELTVMTEKFLTGKDRKQLHQVHEGIVTLIPDVKNKELLNGDAENAIDLTKSMESLFNDYFKFRHGQEPNERLMKLFKEVLSTEQEKDRS